jgi:SAM-dependent methyltransferase
LADDPWGEDPLPFLRDATWSLVKCAECSQVFHSKILNEEWNERRFTKWMNTESIIAFEKRLGPRFPRAFDTAINYVSHILRIEKLTRTIRKHDEPVRLLDFGCGFGNFLEACAHFGFTVEGVDRSEGRRDKAHINIAPSLAGLANREFHAITLFETLEHLDHPAHVLSKLAKLIIAGGVLVLETPDCTGVTDIKTHYDYLKAHPLEHINCFTHESLKSIAERNGFAEMKQGPAFVTTEIPRVIKRMGKHALGRVGASTQIYFRKL